MLSRFSLPAIITLVSVAGLVSAPPTLAQTKVKPNILFICVDDLRPELGCYGKSHMHTPNIDQLAAQGRVFSRHYVQVPTCGASRHSLVSGRYPRAGSDRGNGAISARAKNDKLTPTFPQVFKNNGYSTVAVGKVTHYPGGLMGSEWNDPKQVEMPGAWDRNLMPSGEWKTPRNAMHGIANGVPRTRGKTPALEIKEGPDTLYPDGLITNTAIQQLGELTKSEQPWLLAVGIIKPHLPFTAPKKYWDLYEGQKLPEVTDPEKPKRFLTWNGSGEFFGGYNHQGKDPRKDAEYAALVRRYYYASVSYADAQVGKILTSLEKSGQKNNTIVVLWGDHGWNLGEKAIWGKHSLYEESLQVPLIISTPGISKAGTPAQAITETIDIFPTLCDLTGVPAPDGLDGVSLKAQLDNPAADSDGLARSFWGGSQSIRTDKYRLTRGGKKDQTNYNLFLFPETEAPDQAKVDSVSSELAPKFFKP
ncbi:sulfatase [Oceaniferula spumae]